jgi:hypothetical protein
MGHKVLLWLQPKLCRHPHHYSAPQLITITPTQALARNCLQKLQAPTDISKTTALRALHQSVASDDSFLVLEGMNTIFN